MPDRFDISAHSKAPDLDRHTLAAINLAGTLLDLMGGLYLAYDLLGGRKGPLRVITRITTYSLVFGLGYGLPLGVRFGLSPGPDSASPLGWSSGAPAPAPRVDGPRR